MKCVKNVLAVCMLVGVVVGEKPDYVSDKLCPVGFLVVCKCSSVLLQSTVIKYVILVTMGMWTDDSAC